MKDKDLTKQKIIHAVGEVFKTEGQKGLYITILPKKPEWTDH